MDEREPVQLDLEGAEHELLGADDQEHEPEAPTRLFEPAPAQLTGQTGLDV